MHKIKEKINLQASCLRFTNRQALSAHDTRRIGSHGGCIERSEKGMAAKDLRVLIVDDYATMRRILKSLLEQLGIKNVEEANDGVGALHKLQSSKFDLVISDWNMEPMSGLQLLKECRSDQHLKSIPFIMVTAESKTENVLVAKEAGVNNYIVKPFNAATLKSKIESVVGPLQ